MTRFSIAALLSILSASTLTATEPPAYVVPVVTAKVKDRIYSTTLALRNDGTSDVACEAIYAVPNDPKGGTLRASYTVPRGGRPHVEEDVLMEVGAVGTMRLACSGHVAIAARIQSSIDGGQTFDEGRTYAALDESSSFRLHRTLTASSDLLVAEVAGKAVTVEATVKNDAGVVIGRKTYEVPAFAQQIVNLSKVREDVPSPHVELRIVGGTGALVVGEETRDPALLKMAVRMTPETRRAFEQHQARQVAAVQVASSGPSITEQLLICPFKAAPFRDPATGLCFMRDRWYDPSTGTFLTPDPEGYGDSSNLYIFGRGDPVNNSDPTGRYIDESRVLNSPLRNRYVKWRDDYRSSRLGRQAWDRIMAIPANRFTLTMQPLAGTAADDTGAIAERVYDPTGQYVGGSISFGKKFGSSSPDPNVPDNLLMYPRAFDVEKGVVFSRERYRVYSFGHEFGHILSGFDPTTAADARQFTALAPQLSAVGNQIIALLTKQRTAGLTPLEQATLVQLQQQQQQLKTTLDPLKLRSEQYGDAIGYEFFRSWNLDHHRIFEHPNPNPAPALPPGALPPP